MIELTDANGVTLYVSYDEITHFAPAIRNSRWYGVLSYVFLRKECLEVRDSMETIAQQLASVVLKRVAYCQS